MKQATKRILCLALCFCLTLSLLPSRTFAAAAALEELGEAGEPEEDLLLTVNMDLDFTDTASQSEDEGNLEKAGYFWDLNKKTLTFSKDFSVATSGMDMKLPAGATVVLNEGADVTVKNVYLNDDEKAGSTEISGKGALTVSGTVTSEKSVNFSLAVDGATLNVEGTINNGGIPMSPATR